MTDKNVKIRRAKHDKENPYYMASRATSQDKALSYEALGILHYVLSKPDDWEIQPTDLERKDCGRNRVYRLLNELIASNYIERIYNRDKKGRVQSVEYVAHETPHAEKPLPENQEMEKQEVENPEMEKRHITEYREEHKTEKTVSPRKRDEFFDAIVHVWGNAASGWVGSMKSMMLGTAKKGEWQRCAFDPPVNDANEILAFDTYMLKRMREKRLTDKPTACVTIQRWFYDFRAENAKKLIKLDAPPVDLSKWETPDPFAFLESEGA